MAEDLDIDEFDEFGNPLGENGSDNDLLHGLESEYESQDSEIDIEAPESARGDDADDWEDASDDPEAGALSTTVYGPSVELQHFDADTQDLSEPLVAPETVPIPIAVLSQPPPPVTFSREFHSGILAHNSRLIRNVAIVGHLGHGKTTLVDCMLAASHPQTIPQHFTDTHSIEIQRGISIKTNCISLVVSDDRGKSWVANCADAPGHPDFLDETAVAMRLSQGILLVVDVVEGLLPSAKMTLKNAKSAGLSVVLVLTKLDRLMLDLQLPPAHATARIQNVVSEVSAAVPEVVPQNVVFSSPRFGWAFTLASYARLYDSYGPGGSLDPIELWQGHAFTKCVLEPLYKLVSAGLSADCSHLKRVLGDLGIKMPRNLHKKEPEVLIHDLFCIYFEDSSWTALWKVIVDVVPAPFTPSSASPESANFGVPEGSNVIETPSQCTVEDELAGEVVKMVAPGKALVRILRGVLASGKVVTTLNSRAATIESIWIPCTRYDVLAAELGTGAWALVTGLPDMKHGYFAAGNRFLESHHLPPLVLPPAVMKVGVEALQSTREEAMAKALEATALLWPGINTRVSASGEYILFAPGELYLDCFLHDLRHILSPQRVTIRASLPSTPFRETVGEPTYALCPSRTSDNQCSVTMLADPLPENLSMALEHLEPTGTGSLDKNQIRPLLVSAGYSNLDVASLLAVRNGSVVADDTLGSAPSDLNILQAVIQGFSWAVSEGPLCDEPIRAVRFRMAEASIPAGATPSQLSQLVPAVRKACHASLLVSSPRLLEPWLRVVVLGAVSSGKAVYTLLGKRRGLVDSDEPIPGTPFAIIQGILPAIDSFGLEADLKMATGAAGGLSQVTFLFESWRMVPGDPMDATQTTRRLHPAESPAGLARDFMVKTRRRAGLGGDPVLTDFVEPEIAAALGLTDTST